MFLRDNGWRHAAKPFRPVGGILSVNNSHGFSFLVKRGAFLSGER
jgi:hypothetical protein